MEWSLKPLFLVGLLLVAIRTDASVRMPVTDYGTSLTTRKYQTTLMVVVILYQGLGFKPTYNKLSVIEAILVLTRAVAATCTLFSLKKIRFAQFDK